jgi:hypothetical protein
MFKRSHIFILFACIFPIYPQVGQWDRFETSVTNGKSYSDPYNDVTLNVTYTRPDNSTIMFWGFYDGGTTWKIRFIPDRVGNWNYSATFSDGTTGISGGFECTASNIPGMIAKDETNPMWFGYKGGNHVLVRSFHVGDRFFASNWSNANRSAFLNWAKGQGYNMLSVASHYLNREESGRGAGWDTPDLWNNTTKSVQAAEYRKMEAILNDLSDRQIMVWPFAGFFGQSSDFPTGHTDQERYIRYTLARIGPYWNVLFNVAGPEPLIKAAKFQSAMTSSDIKRIGALIKSLDVFGHLITIHNATGDDPFKDDAWHGFGTLQGPKTNSQSTLSSGLLKNHHPSKPLYAQETLWAGNVYHPSYSATVIRKNTYVVNMSATALNFADMNGNSSSGFSGSLDLADRTQSRHDIVKKVWDYIESVPFYNMSPRQDLVNNGYCLAEPGHRYLVYLTGNGSVNVSVSGGPYQVEWINAQNTSDRRSSGTTTNGQNLTSPTDGDDWLVYLSSTTDITVPSPDLQAIEQGAVPDIVISPNPVKPAVTIQIRDQFLQQAAELRIFNIHGKTVREFRNITRSVLQWDGRHSSGKEAASGIYIIVLKTAGHLVTRRISVIR